MADVVLVRWPEEREDAARLVEAGVAVLYLVDADADPPEPTTCLEDWVRMPGDDRDLRARLVALEARAASHRMPPTIDGAGRLRYHGKLLPLSAEEARWPGLWPPGSGPWCPTPSWPPPSATHAGLRSHMTPAPLPAAARRPPGEPGPGAGLRAAGPLSPVGGSAAAALVRRQVRSGPRGRASHVGGHGQGQAVGEGHGDPPAFEGDAGAGHRHADQVAETAAAAAASG